MTSLMAPVTDTLANVLAATSTALESAAKKGNWNDKDDYGTIVAQLEELTVAVLSASSSLPLIGVRPAGARFDIGSETRLARHVTACAVYLREDASSRIMRSSSLSAYDSGNVDVAVKYLQELHGLVKEAVLTQAKADLRTISDLGPNALVLAAEYLAGRVQAKKS